MSLQGTLTSICNSLLLPFSSKKNRRLPVVDRSLAKRHTDTLKWQQESFHRMLHLIGLHKEGIISENEVSTFRARLLGTLVASPDNVLEPANVVRDKLLFLKELFYARCISEEEYHSSKRPLLHRLAAHGAEVDCRDIIIGGGHRGSQEEEWSVIELHDNNGQEDEDNTKHKSPLVSLWNKIVAKEKQSHPSNPYGSHDRDKESESVSILMPQSSPLLRPSSKKSSKRKPFRSLFHLENKNEKYSNCNRQKRSPRKQQSALDGFKKWIKSSEEEERMAPCLDPVDENSSFDCPLVAGRISDGPSSQVLGDKIKKELSRIRSELRETNPKLEFSNDEMQAISAKLPVEKNDLENFFPKSWCESHGDVVLDVMRREFRDHVNELERSRLPNVTTMEKKKGEELMMIFEEENDENSHPNHLFPQKKMNSVSRKMQGLDDDDAWNPFWDEEHTC